MRRLSSAATVGTLLGLILILILPGCGGEPAVSAGGKANAPTAAPAQGSGAERTCRAQLRGFVGSLDALRELLATGLDYASYLREVRGVRAEHAAIRAAKLAIGCLIASGTPAERAFNQYIDAANAWGECLTKASCEIESIEPELQRRWARAGDLISAAQRGLRETDRS
jgi:hypothetical protein